MIQSQIVPRLTPAAKSFVQSVLDRRPKLAVFDCDGTLWKENSGERFFDWEIERGLVSTEVAKALRARYEDYRRGLVSEDDMCGEMVTMHCGLANDELERAAREFFDELIVGGIFPEMKLLVERMMQQGCDVWAISSTNDWVVNEGVSRFGIPVERAISASVVKENGRATDRLIHMPSGEGKAKAIRQIIKQMPDAVFGNSRWDLAMLELARVPYAINPNPDLEEIARHREWTIYQPMNL
jgi:HAD superfamily phosphoserine phosphatase-like hydrolase